VRHLIRQLPIICVAIAVLKSDLVRVPMRLKKVKEKVFLERDYSPCDNLRKSTGFSLW
jgi:hypothetical protein